jgi:hypothetical protein
MEDLAQEDRRAIERELKEEMADRRHKKLACLQKMCHSVITEADTMATSGTKVNSPLALKILSSW